mgnify:FL=1
MAFNSLCDGRFLFNLYRSEDKGIVLLSGAEAPHIRCYAFAQLVLSLSTLLKEGRNKRG